MESFTISPNKIPYTGTGGKSIMCLQNDPSTFYLENSNYRVLGIDKINWSKCALLIVNINRAFNASQSYLEDPSLANSSIYCGACMPGFMASHSSKLKNPNYDLKYIPFYVY